MPVPPRPAYIGDDICTQARWASAPFEERVLFVARSQERAKVRETTANWGPMVKMYLKVAGIFFPAAWCAAFKTWCALEAGAVRSKLPRFSASTLSWYVWAKKNGRLRTKPARGLWFVWNGKRGGHIGGITSAKGDVFTAIEGNTNDDGSREGHSVLDRRRTVASLTRYPRWGFIDISGLDKQ